MFKRDWISEKVFQQVHKNNLVYNTCWEDPRLDRVALEVTPEDNILVITSAGCNALDYALDNPNHVYAVDMNSRQNALLDLKLACIKSLDYDSFFKLFGEGSDPGFKTTYRKTLRDKLPEASRKFWDKHLYYFSGKGSRWSFYFKGTSGLFAYLINFYIDHIGRFRKDANAILNADTLTEQRKIYPRIKDKMFSGFIRWALGRDATLSLLGVPRPQRQQIERTYEGGIVKFIQDCVEAVFSRLPLRDNYFWRVYMTGEYTKDCCPEYLKKENFEKLRSVADRVSSHTASVESFLKGHKGTISRYILLDHMDWLSTHKLSALESEWQQIVDHAAPNTRILFRSGGTRVDYVDPIRVFFKNLSRRLGDMLQYSNDLAASLHEKDRVHTYGSFYIADLKTA